MCIFRIEVFMKKLQIIYIMLFCGFFFNAGQTVRAEQVASTINYNPSRMGVFSYLKISNALNLLGGVSATTLNLKGNNKELQSNSKQLSIPTISGNSGTIKFNQAVLSGRIEAGDQSYSYTDTPNSTSTAGTITLYGGTLTASNDSYIHTLKQVGRLKTYANTLNAPSVTVNGDGGSALAFINSSGNSEGNSYGLKLGNYDIKYPPSGYEYKWVTMKFKDKTAKVLTLIKDGVITPEEEPDYSCTYTFGNWSSQYINCPQGRCCEGIETCAGSGLYEGLTVTNGYYGTGCVQCEEVSWTNYQGSIKKRTLSCVQGSGGGSWSGTWDYHGQPEHTQYYYEGTNSSAETVKRKFCGENYSSNLCSARGITRGSSCPKSSAQNTCLAYCNASDFSGHGNYNASKRALICME